MVRVQLALQLQPLEWLLCHSTTPGLKPPTRPIPHPFLVQEALIDLAARSPVDSSNGSSKRRASSASREPSALGRLCSAVAAAFAEETTVVNVHSDSPLAVTGDVAHTHIEFDAATKLAQALATQVRCHVWCLDLPVPFGFLANSTPHSHPCTAATFLVLFGRRH